MTRRTVMGILCITAVFTVTVKLVACVRGEIRGLEETKETGDMGILISTVMATIKWSECEDKILEKLDRKSIRKDSWQLQYCGSTNFSRQVLYASGDAVVCYEFMGIVDINKDDGLQSKSSALASCRINYPSKIPVGFDELEYRNQKMREFVGGVKSYLEGSGIEFTSNVVDGGGRKWPTSENITTKNEQYVFRYSVAKEIWNIRIYAREEMVRDFSKRMTSSIDSVCKKVSSYCTCIED